MGREKKLTWMVVLTAEHVCVHWSRKSPEGTSSSCDAVKFVVPIVMFNAAAAILKSALSLREHAEHVTTHSNRQAEAWTRTGQKHAA